MKRLTIYRRLIMFLFVKYRKSFVLRCIRRLYKNYLFKHFLLLPMRYYHRGFCQLFSLYGLKRATVLWLFTDGKWGFHWAIIPFSLYKVISSKKKYKDRWLQLEIINNEPLLSLDDCVEEVV